MIRFFDALKLAYTKIRTRKIRLVITVFVAGLLFVGLTASSLIFNGIITSIESFSDEGFNKRYIISGAYTDTSSFKSENGSPMSNPALIARAETLEKERQAKRKAVAERLGIEFVQDESEKAVQVFPDGNKSLNPMTVIGQQVLAESDTNQTAKPTLAAFQKQIGSNASKFYQAQKIAIPGMLYNAPKLTPLLDGKEKYDTVYAGGGFPGTTQGLAGITDSWTLMDDSLMKPFLLPGQNLERDASGSIPIVISYSAAQELLKYSKLDTNATLEQKKQRLIDTRREIAGKAFSMCYRNSAAQFQLQKAIEQQSDLKQNGTKKEYKKPELLYDVPASPCTSPVIQRDVRSAEAKRLDEKQETFNLEFGAQKPTSELLKFRVVGVSPDRSMPMGMPGIEDIISMMTMSTLGSSWVSPLTIRDSSPALKDVFRIAQMGVFEPQQFYAAEFSSPDAARQVLKERNCINQFPGMPLEPGQVACAIETRPFALQSFGSASLALEDIKATFKRFQLIAAIVVTVLASVILMGMIGRIVADARKETAVFRAVGASRMAIAQIYITYTMYLSLMIIVMAFVIGFAVALWVDSRYSANTSVTMALLFNVADLGKQFHFYTLNWYDVGLIAVVVAAASIVGAMVPIAHNIQRNPIRDMREE